MVLKIKIEAPKDDVKIEQDIQLLKQVLQRNGITMRHVERRFGEEIYTIRGQEQKIRQKMSRGAGAKPKTKDLKIETVLDIEKKYRRMPVEKEEALAQVGLKLRRYQQIKKDIRDKYDSLENAIERGYIYFVSPGKRNN